MSQFSSRDDMWITCPQCATPMLPLADYEIHKSSESPGVGADLWQFLLFGWWAFVINFVSDFWTFEGRKKKLAALKARYCRSFRARRCARAVWS